MFFEGTEKKVEIVVSSKLSSLRQKPQEFWKDLVRASKAEILSHISSDVCDAYLLSESSLFVYDERMTMITCGRTVLGHAASFFVKHIGAENIASLIFERKNEHFPHQQPSNFFSDVQLLKEQLPGMCLQFGEKDEHHLQMFCLDKPFNPNPTDMTLEVLMYGIQGRAREAFCKPRQPINEIVKTGVREIFEDFTVDDYQFKPMGYSLNALSDSNYYTIHVTPEDIGTYVSFETNYVDPERVTSVVSDVVDIFKPRSFDVILFHPERIIEVKLPEYYRRSLVTERIKSGYHVSFAHYFEPHSEDQHAIVLDIPERI